MFPIWTSGNRPNFTQFRCCLMMQGLSMTSKRAYGAAVVLDDALYVLGGMEDMSQSFKTNTLKVSRHWFLFYIINNKRGSKCCVLLNLSIDCLLLSIFWQTKWWIVQIERFVESTGWEDVAHDAVKNRSFVAAAVLWHENVQDLVFF